MTRVLIIEARYYEHVNDLLLDGVKETLDKANAEYDVLSVPGALEIPAALKMSVGMDYDAFVVMGCIIRGETSHYDIVCNESARGVYDTVMDYDLALGNAILTALRRDGVLE